MDKRTLGGVVLAATLATAVAGYSFTSAAQPGGDGGWGPGMMGYGSGYGPGPWMMGPGMMYGHGGGYGAGPWMTGHGWMGPGMMGWGGCGPGARGWGWRQPADLALTVDEVKNNMEQWLKATGNSHIKLGDVKAKDADSITADIITTDKDALVQRYEVNRHSGFVRPTGE